LAASLIHAVSTRNFDTDFVFFVSIIIAIVIITFLYAPDAVPSLGLGGTICEEGTGYGAKRKEARRGR
jgi:hypothetical protein